MQLKFKGEFTSFTPPKGQLIKWVGNKQKFAAEIVSFFPKKYNTFYEPFLGSGAIMATLSPKKGVGSDTFNPLIQIFNKLKSDPDGLVNWYSLNRNKLNGENKKEVYESVKNSFNTNNNGRDFLYLTRSCYGGIVRFRKSDGYMSTPCGAHNPMPVNNFSQRVFEWHDRMKNIDFLNEDYKKIFSKAKEGDLIYCDPPYTYSQGILYGAQSFNLNELFEEIKDATKRGVKVALSIDGTKKSGEFICDLPIPVNVFKEEVYIGVGRSMLKRFQKKGQSLEDEIVTDRLMMNYSL
jgi:DNA adenine methylase